MTVEELIEQLQRLPASAPTALVRVRIETNIRYDGFVASLDRPRSAAIRRADYNDGVVTLRLDE